MANYYPRDRGVVITVTLPPSEEQTLFDMFAEVRLKRASTLLARIT